MSNDKVSVVMREACALGSVERSGGERSEPERSGTDPKAQARPEGGVPNSEVSSRPQRRRFTAEYKACIVKEAEACRDSGQIGAMLRREGLYSSHLSKWRRLYEMGALTALKDDKRGSKASKHPLEDEVARLRKQNARLTHRLQQAETIIEIQKKVSTILGIPMKDDQDERNG